MSSLDLLRRKIGIEKRNLCLDFSATRRMGSAGTLLLVAELRRLMRSSEGSVSLSCKLPDNDKICQVLKQIGVVDLLGATTVAVPKDDDVVNWRYAQGSQVEGKKYEDILKDFDGEMAHALQEGLYEGITEAMTNVLNHAYDVAGRNDGLNIDNRDWWMFSQERDGYLSVVFCDLGAGIPRTLPIKRPSIVKRLLRLGKSSDADAIEYAVKDSISRTKQEHRGKGLAQIVGAVEAVNDGEVVVLSNKGAYMRDSNGSRTRTYRDSIMGTLIHWRVPLHGGVRI